MKEAQQDGAFSWRLALDMRIPRSSQILTEVGK
jgi:hypothetical protein